MSISPSADDLHKVIDQNLQRMGMEGVTSHDIINVIDDHIGGGYGVASKELKGQLTHSLKVL